MFRYDRLEERIRETGKKKVYLCERLQKCPTYLRDAKKQNTNIKGDDLRILAEELDTTPEYLTGETDQKTKSPAPESAELDPVTRELFDIVNTSDEDELKTLLEMARLIKKRRN